MTQSLKDWDEGKDAEILGRLKYQGSHFLRPNDLLWMQRRVAARGWKRYLAPIALAPVAEDKTLEESKQDFGALVDN